MDLRLTDEQAQLVDAFASLYARHATPEQVRAAEPGGFDQALWDRLLELGVVAMAVDEALGGWGASPLELALVAEQHGRNVAPAPLIEAQVAARLLAGSASPQARAALSGERLVTVALHPPVDGRVRGVPAGSVADDAIVWTGDELLLAPPRGNARRLREPRVDAAGRRRRRPKARSSHQVSRAAPRSRRPSTSGCSSPLRRWSASARDRSRSASSTSRSARPSTCPSGPSKRWRTAWPTRRPPSTVPGCSTYEAAWAAEDDPGRATELAALAFAFAAEAARDASYRSLHFHGGYGFMMEYDIQLFWRRARAWTNVWAEPAAGYRRAADARYGRR